MCPSFHVGKERGKEHLAALEKKSEDSVMWLYSLHHHQGREKVRIYHEGEEVLQGALRQAAGGKRSIFPSSGGTS